MVTYTRLHFLTQGLKQPSYSTYWDQEDIHSYLRVTNLPPLTELTACFYFEPSHDDPLDALRDNGKGRIQHLISIASPSEFCEFYADHTQQQSGYKAAEVFMSLTAFRLKYLLD